MDQTPGLPADLTLEQLLEICVRLQPTEAAASGNSALCVTPLVTCLIIEGKPHTLRLRNGRHGAGYTRVSGNIQRAAGSEASKTKKKINQRTSTQQVVDGAGGARGPARVVGAADGYSEEEQLLRQIRYFAREGLAFKIYSDCGLTGEYPTNDPRLIRRLLDGKAERYRKIFERTLLDETSLLRRTPEQIASMRAYLAKRVATIKGGLVTDDEYSNDANTDEATGGNGDGSKKRGHPRKQAFFRQAYTQLWCDIEADLVDATAVSDRSRLCRSADLESEFLVLLSAHGTKLIGLIEDLSTLDVSDPIKKGFAYLIASVNEYRLEETAGHSFRGLLQLLESGHPHGRPPWWLVRNAEGRAVEMPEYVGYARRAAELYLSGLGVSAIETKLHEEGVVVGGQPLTTRMIRYVLESEAVAGVHWQFGLAWDVFPRLLPEETVQALRERRWARRDLLVPQFGQRIPGRTAPNHVFTGLLRCSCGLLLRYSHPSKPRRDGGTGYYYCPAPHKKARGGLHAWVNEDKLGAFLGELLGQNPHLIADAISGGADRAAARCACRRLLEAQLQQARVDYVARQDAARVRAANAAVAVGIGEAFAGFASVVAEISQALLEAEREELTRLEAEMAILAAETYRDQQAAQMIGVVERFRSVTQLSGFAGKGEGLERGEGLEKSDMDILTRNVLLKVIFSEITIYPLRPKKWDVPGDATPGEARPPHGCFIMHLAGTQTPLPPIRMRRGPRKEMRLPTVGEWITDVFALASVEEVAEPVPGARVRRAFRTYLKEVGSDSTLGTLSSLILTDPDYPRRLKGKGTLVEYVAHRVRYDGVREQVDEAWACYMAVEYGRLMPVSTGKKRRRE